MLRPSAIAVVGARLAASGVSEQPERVAEQRLRDGADVVGDRRVGQAVLRVDREQPLEAARAPRRSGRGTVGGGAGVEPDSARLGVAAASP